MKKFKFTDIIIGIVFTLLLISLAVVFTINFRPLYYLDVEILDIVERSGYPKQEILDNYNALIDYSSPFFTGDLNFPTLPASENGLQHFREVKDIFTFFYILGAVTLVISICIAFHKHKKKDYQYLIVSSITAITLPILVGLALAIDFDTSFVIFHKIFFNNDYWIFDSVTDPVIKILPYTFFLHCALLIILLVILGSILLAILYYHRRKYFSIRYRKNKGLNL